MNQVAAEELEGLTPREIVAGKALLAGASVTEAAKAAGYKSHGALRPGGPIRSAVQRALHRNGAYARAHQVVRETLDAKTTKFFPAVATRNKIGTCADCGEDFTVTAMTVFCPSCRSAHFSVREELDLPARDVVAHGPRLDAARLVYQLHGDLAQAEQQASHPTGPVAVQVVIMQPQAQTQPTTGIQVVTIEPGSGSNGANGHAR